MRFVWTTTLLAMGLTAPALAMGPAVEIGVGGGVSSLDGTVPRMDDSLGGRFNLGFSFPIIPDLPQLRLGVGFSVEGASETGRRGDVDGDGDDDRPYSNLIAFTPEVKLAWSQLLGDRWFIEPSVAVVAPIARYSIGDIEYYRHHHHEHADIYEDEDWTAVGFGIRPALAVGFWLNDRHAIGLEGSYLMADLDFGDGIGGHYRAFALSLFYRFAF